MYLAEKNRIPLTLDEILENINSKKCYSIVEFDVDILQEAANIQFYELHDRLILATAKLLGTPVISVDGGQVQTITWQRGRGNIIIISHDHGYYTVYTHLADIRVNPMEYVETGQVIGTVGDSGSLVGPVLHFQIWKNTQNLDPEKWLM